jgi:nucleoside-diphosphate-sugar epimerase
LLGNTPYALSKIQAEQFLKEWCGINNVTLTILRPSLIAGPNPPGNLGAMIKGISTGKYLSIGGGKARKSVLMVQDIANLIPLVADKGGVYNVCDSHHPSFRELEELICRQLNKSGVISVPFCVAKLLANVGDLLGKYAPINSDKLSKITKSLTFSNEKARSTLGWEPLNVLDNFRIK